MEFTLVFKRSNANRGGNFNLVFEPSPIWDDNGKWLINLNPENPHYQSGSLKRLIEQEGLQDVKNCILVVHDYGYGVEGNLEIIKQELTEHGINYKVVKFDEK